MKAKNSLGIIMKIYEDLDEITPVPGTLAVWYRPSLESKRCFYVLVISPDQATDAIEVLQEFDGTRFDSDVKSGSASASGLKVFMDETWKEWYHDNGYDIHEWQNNTYSP
jgi:hypothetical protein